MNTKPKFVYVTLIATTPEKLWEALTNPEFTAQYWGGTRLESDWKVGSNIDFRWRGEVVHHDSILECDPPRRLSYTFHPLHDAELRVEAPSRVTFEIEDFTGQTRQNQKTVKLTVTHDEFPADSKVFPKISQGWPDILSSLKSFLETGQAIEFKW